MIETDCDWEQMTEQEVEDALIATYVPEAGNMSRADALALALQRDEEFALEFDNDLDDDELLKAMSGELLLDDDYEDEEEEDE